jgi:hypothetical protein
MDRAPLKVRAQTLYQVTLEYLRKHLPMAMLVAGCFTVGYAVKNTEGMHDRQIARAELQDQQKSMSAACDARIVQNDHLMQGRMMERDQLLADQSQRIDDLEFLLRDMAERQQTNHRFTEQQIADLKKMTTDTRDSIQREVTAKDRQTINSEVGAKK